MLKISTPQSMTNVGYVSFLMTFAALGMFVYALAVGSAILAVALGLILVACVTVMVMGFRVGARRRSESNDRGIAIDGANVWAQPLRREQIDQYLLQYRSVRADDEEQAEPLAVAEKPWLAVADRLAA